MARRKRDRSADRLEAVLKLVIFGVALIALSVGGVKGFPSIFGSLLAGLMALVAAVAVLVGLGILIAFLVRRRRAQSAFVVEPAIQTPARAPREPNVLTHELLHAMEWKRFEQVASCYFELLGFRTETARVGADGGIDIKLFKDAADKPAAIVQCKAWNSYSVGVKPVRELFGVMAAENAPHGVFLTTSTFTEEAKAFAAGKSLELIDAGLFLGQIRRLPADAQTKLLNVAIDGDYTTPTCPSCGIKMIQRTAGKGSNAGSKFWGCRNYPRCKRTFQMSSATASANVTKSEAAHLLEPVVSPALRRDHEDAAVYFYTTNGVEHGPVNQAIMRELLRTQKVTPFQKIERSVNGVRGLFDARIFGL